MKFALPRPLRDLAFRRFWFGQTISLFGDQITLLALPLAAVLVLHAGLAQMGYLGAASLVPKLTVALLVVSPVRVSVRFTCPSPSLTL